MDSLPIRVPEDSPGATADSVKSEDSSPRQDPGRGSPPPNCAICLGTCRNKSFTDSCLHQFCFKCLLTWSKVKAECPLCKQNFRSIIHNVRSNHQYEEYMVEQRHTEELSERIDIDNLTATRRFRYRTTLTLPRQNTIAIRQLLLHHYPMVAELLPGPPAPRRRSPASFRRTVYRYNLWARPLPDFTRRFRDCSPDFYRHNPSQMHRLVPWLNRELHYLLNENVGHIAYVVARILELLPQYSINSTEFRDTMRLYFADNTDHFLHELYCFASTPYDMNGYDRHVQYTTDHTISTMVNNVLSSSDSDASVDSDIVMISSPADAPPGPSRPAPVYPQNYITDGDGVIPIETISQSDTEDDSSEVMVVGYIKPPQDRTPEVVDLLGSDSDVIVQDNAPAELAPREPTPLVKLTLARHDAPAGSESAHTPSPSPPRRPRRLRRPHRPRSRSASSDSSASSYDDPSSSSDSAESARQRKSRHSRRKLAPERVKRRAKKRARKQRNSKKELNISPGREKQSKHKSHSGKGVKSSKKSAVPKNDAPPVETGFVQPVDEPSTSGISRGTSGMSHGTNGISLGTNDASCGSSEIPCGSGISLFMKEISRVTNDMSQDPTEVSCGTSELFRCTSETSHDASGIPRGTTVISYGTSDISPGNSTELRSTIEVSRDSNNASSSTSEVYRDTNEANRDTTELSRSAVKHKLEWNTRRRKSKRLKSVVNVINSQTNSELANLSAAGRGTDSDSDYVPTDQNERSDSEDDLPLNLSIVKGSR